MPNAFGYDYTPEPLKPLVTKSKDGKVTVEKPKFLVDDISVDYILDESGKPTGDTQGVVTGQTDLVESIQTHKDECGLSFIMREMANGRVNPSSLVDDKRINGDFGGDFTGPTMSAEALTVLAQDLTNKVRLEKLAESLGVTADELLNCKDLNALIKSKISPAPAEQKATAEVKADNSKEAK